MSETTAIRKLTTILASDVVGYSKMMARDEEATLRTLRTYRTVTDGLVNKHNGRVFSTAGDSFLAEFGSAVEAVRCAISIQEDLAVRNAELPEGQQMWLRIGINVGDVMIEGEDLFGDGVNIAARLEGLAEKGGICISGSTFDQVKSKLSITFDDIGAQTVKNIPDPIPAFRVVPGRVTVSAKGQGEATTVPESWSRMKLFAMSFAFAVVLGTAAYYSGFLTNGKTTTNPFDGHWKVTVDSLSGCNDNNPKSFSMKVQNGRIDEPQQQLPKSGEISVNGDVSIRSTDRSGNLRNTQIAKIAGDVGKGRFHGMREKCVGSVTMVRLD